MNLSFYFTYYGIYGIIKIKGIIHMKNYILRITIDDSDIWRRISFPHGFTFKILHEVIQIIFGWQNYHLHECNASGLSIISREMEDVDPDDYSNVAFENDIDIDVVLMNETAIDYTYDYGQEWQLTIEIEKKEEKGTNYPILMEYGGLMAREDCDGVSGLKKLGGEIVSLDRINKILHERFKVD